MNRTDKASVSFHKPWKKVLCCILSVIIALGTFVTFTFGNSRFQKWLGIKSVLSAYAAEMVDTKGAIAVDEEAMFADDHTISLENRDGTNTAYLFCEPISYTDENGNLKTKDISVEKADKNLKSKGYDYTNGQNDYRINFSKDYNKGVQAEFNGCSYSIIPLSDYDTAGDETVAGYLNEKFEVFQYKNIYGEGTNLRFYPQLNGIKDEIILDSNIGQSYFSFRLETDNCIASLKDDGSVVLTNGNDETVQTFSKPFAYDNVFVEGIYDEHYTDCQYSLEELSEGIYILTVSVDKEWLESDNTVYPVVIDPTTGNSVYTEDAGIYTGMPNNNYGNEQTGCMGLDRGYGYGRVLTYFPMPSYITQGATIHSAYSWQRETTGSTTTSYIRPYVVTTGWSESYVKWNNRPNFTSGASMSQKLVNSTSTDKSGNPYWYRFDITPAVRAWRNGTYQNYGLYFISSDDWNNTYDWRAFASRSYNTSAMRPYYVINYTNDLIAPTVSSVTGNATEWTNGNVTLTVNGAQDNDGGVGLHTAAYSFSTTPGEYDWRIANSLTFSSNCTVYIYVRDGWDNKRLVSTQVIDKIDKTAPAVPTVTGNATDWTTQSVTLTASSSDSASGIKDYSFSAVQGVYSWQTENTKTFDSNTTVYVYARDNAGNISQAQEVNIDKITDNPEYLLDLSFYEENHKIGINNPRNNNDSIQYKIGDNGEWVDYIVPFDIPINDEITVYAKFKDTSRTISQVFTSKANEYINNFTESKIDLTITFSGVFFDISRCYNSYNNQWYFSTNTKIEDLNNNTIKLLLPNSSTLIFTKKDNYSYVNKKTNYSLSVLHNDSGIVGYTVNMNDIIYSYNYLGMLISVSDINENTINFEYEDNNLSRIYYGVDEVREYLVDSSNGLIYSITTPLGETIKYLYDSYNNLTDVYYDKDTLQIMRDNNIILGHYEYQNNKMSVCDTDEIFYADGKLSKVIRADGSYANYSISIVNDNEVYGDEAYNASVYKVISSTSDGKVSNSYYNSALNLIKYTDSDDSNVLYKYDVYQNLISKKDNYNSEEYVYNGIILSSSDIKGVESTYNEYGSVISQKDNDTTTTYSYLDDGITLTKLETVLNKRNSIGVDPKVIHLLTNNYQNGKLHSTIEKITDTMTDNFGITTVSYNDDSTVVSITTESTVYSKDNVATTEKETVSLLYDDFGNIIRSQSVNEGKDEIKVSVNNIEYDDNNRKTVVTDNAGNIEQKYMYDSVDNTVYENISDEVSRTIYDEYSRVTRKITSEDYNENCDGLLGEVKQDSYSDDTAGYTYIYDENGNIQSETDRDGLTTTYSYYENSSTVKTESFDSYVFTYDENGNTIKETISGQIYAEYMYNDENNPTIVAYGNGQSIRYEYDDNGNLKKQYHNEDTNPFVEYFYAENNTGQDYDLTNEIVQEAEVNISLNPNYKLVSKINYDTEQKTVYSDNLVTVYSIDNNKLYSYNLKASKDSNNVYSRSYSSASNSSVDINNNYDEDIININRNDNIACIRTLHDRGEIVEGIITYYNIMEYNSNSISAMNYDYDINGLVQNESLTFNGKHFEYNYTYDDNGKILSCILDENNKITYQYDESTGAILKEENKIDSQNMVYEYSYDSRGNMLTSTQYDNGLSATINYNVDDSIWCDELSSYEDNNSTVQFLYDESGNPVSINDVSFDWISGRLLNSIYTINEQGEKIVLLSYTYDEKGIRTSKTYQGVTTYYTSIDGMITSQYERDKNGNVINEIIFIYDIDNRLIAFTYNNETYFYLKNSLNDVLAVLDSESNVVVKYLYDAWGNPYSIEYCSDEDGNRIDEINPILYRGYYYDMELKAYYLQSRYYMPIFHRFLNPDIPEIVRQKRHEYSGINLFTYCCNDPVNKYDSNGTWGSDVHDGYNPDSKNHFYSLKDSGVDDFYGTYYWATIVGYNHILAKNLGEYDNSVDKVYSSSGPKWKDYDKWHFYTMDGEDVRSEISHEQQCIAKEYLNNATTAYYKYQNYKQIYGKNNSYTTKQYGSYKTNLDMGIVSLAYSLHPIQDMFAHTRDYCHQFINKRWFHSPINVDKASQHIYEVLGPTASITLEILLTFYNSYYILRLQKSYFL